MDYPHHNPSDPYAFRDCKCPECVEKCLAPVSGSYYVISQGSWRSVLCDEGREETFASVEQAERALHEEFNRGASCYVEQVVYTKKIVKGTYCLGKLHDRREFWVKSWERYAKTRSGRSEALKNRVANKIALAKLALEICPPYYGSGVFDSDDGR